MPKNLPLFLLVFANLRDAYLEQLEKESSEMNKALAPLHDNDTIEIYREESATSEEISEMLLRFGERITLLHYGGHANASFLALEDTNANAQGLANLLGTLPKLQLVFLNGCATLGQVRLLFDAGVKAVIATAVPINDHKAVQFASHFYKALGRNNNIQMAFQFAVYSVQAFSDKTLKATIVRRGELATFEDTQAMPWGLFLNNTPEAVDIELWKIVQHDKTIKKQNPDGGDVAINSGFSADDQVSAFSQLDIDDDLFTSDEWLAIGMQAYEAQDFIAAQDYFAKAVAANYENENAWYYRGLTVKHHDKYEAKNCFERVLGLNPNREDAKKQLNLLSNNQTTTIMDFSFLSGLTDTAMFYLTAYLPSFLMKGGEAISEKVGEDIYSNIKTALSSNTTEEKQLLAKVDSNQALTQEESTKVTQDLIVNLQQNTTFVENINKMLASSKYTNIKNRLESIQRNRSTLDELYKEREQVSRFEQGRYSIEITRLEKLNKDQEQEIKNLLNQK